MLRKLKQIGARSIDGRLHIVRGAINVLVNQIAAEGKCVIISNVLDEVISVTPGDGAQSAFQRRGNG